jgi:hypothetical protein
MRFVLQVRAISHSDEIKIGVELNSSLLPVTNVTLSASVLIKYCPVCGSQLADLLIDKGSHFEELASLHEVFLTGLP